MGEKICRYFGYITNSIKMLFCSDRSSSNALHDAMEINNGEKYYKQSYI